MSKKVEFDFKLQGEVEILEETLSSRVDFDSTGFGAVGGVVDENDTISVLGSIADGLIESMSKMIVDQSNNFTNDDERKKAIDSLHGKVIESIVNNRQLSQLGSGFKEFIEKMGELND